MSVASRLVSLYPPPLRSRWGSDLEEEVSAAGWRSWHEVLWSAGDMWLHPATWPATTPAQRWMRASVMAVATALVGGLLGRRLGEPPAVAVMPLAHLALNGSAALAIVGVALLAPQPDRGRPALAQIARCGVVRLGALGILGGGLVALAWSGALEHPSPAVHAAVVTGYWTVLVLGALQVCRSLVELGPTALRPPSPRRLRLGIRVVCAALIGAGATLTTAALGHHPSRSGDLTGLVEGAALLLLALVLARTLDDVPIAATAGSRPR
jgi:hypothetical protein